jgi:hypothetical protein
VLEGEDGKARAFLEVEGEELVIRMEGRGERSDAQIALRTGDWPKESPGLTISSNPAGPRIAIGVAERPYVMVMRGPERPGITLGIMGGPIFTMFHRDQSAGIAMWLRDEIGIPTMLLYDDDHRKLWEAP